jgi:acyl-CoA thioesterase I
MGGNKATMTTICVFGDSIGEGFYDSAGGWVLRLARELKAPNKKYRVFNCCIDAESTREVLLRCKTEITARKPDVVIFALGTNDSYHNGSGSYNVNIADYESNLRQLIKTVRGAEVIIVSAPGVDQTLTTPWQKNIYYDNKSIRTYNEISDRICRELNSYYVDIFELLDEKDLHDGLHPNDLGHEKICQKILGKLLTMTT